MFEKSRIKRILARFPKAEGKERDELLDRLASFGATPVPMVAEEVRYNRILYADAARIFRKIFKKEHIEAYIQGLGDTKESVRDLFKETIERYGGSAAIPALVSRIDDSDHMIRKMCGDILVELGDASTALKVIPYIRSDSKDVKKTAMDVLSSLKYEGAAQAILPLLDDNDSWIKRKAVEALCRLKDRSVLPRLWEVALRDRDPSTMKTVIQTTGEIGGPQDAAPMLRLVKDTDLVVRQKATEAIIKIGDAGLVPRVIELLADSDVNVRRAAVDILNGLKDESTASALVRALKDGDWWVRESATEALGELGGEKISRMVMELLNDSDEYVRRAAVEFYCRVRDEAAFDKLVALLDDGDWWVREKAITALGLIGDPRAIPYISKLTGDGEVKWAIPRALARIGGAEALGPLSAMLRDGQSRTRAEALRAIGGVDLEDALPLVKEVALDADPEIQGLALQILKEKTGRVWLVEDVAAEMGTDRAPATVTGAVGAEAGIFTEAILVIDVCRSTDVADAYGDHLAFQIMDELNNIAVPAARDEGARFTKSTGDGFLMTFDSVENAVRVALRLLREVAFRNAQVADRKKKVDLRFAVNVGETRAGPGGDRIGVAVNMGFRVEGVTKESMIQAHPGAEPEKMLDKNRVLLTEPAYNEIREDPDYTAVFLGFFELKGITGLHRLYQLEIAE
ncbi:MAG: HEAT repeat domain-containing protein [Candidatus Nitrospinota bacterium M3_3B_026]